MTRKRRIFSGMRPTGRLHLGNWLGALSNWVNLQDEYECIFGIVDWHAMTTGYEDPEGLQRNILDVAIDWLSAGIDPQKSIVMVQSYVKEHAELHLLLSMITPVAWVERVPSYKEQIKQLEGKAIATYGFLGYPVLQAADILAYKGEVVPVGEDQLPHLELTREIARRFNYLYKPIFPEPQAIINPEAPLLPGIDGRKMSKSYGNDINMSASPEEIEEKVSIMITDPARARRKDPGHPEVCTVFAFRKLFGPEEVGAIEEDCRKAAVGCVECKKALAERLIQVLAPLHEKRSMYEAKPELVWDMLNEGSERARQIARETLEEVRQVMNL